MLHFNKKYFYLFGTKVIPTTNDELFTILKRYNYKNSNYICVLGFIEILEGITNKELQNAFNCSLFNPLHSRIVEFIAKRKGFKDTKTLDPVWLCTKMLDENLTHFFYGTNDETLSKIEKKINKEFPQAKVVGYKAPPYVDISEIKYNTSIQNDIALINKLKPDIIWISIGGLKQDLLMFHYKDKLDHGLMIGVGAVFDCFAGNIKLRPPWMKRMGISWMYYLAQQPKYRIIKLMKLTKTLVIGLFKKF